jgi:hypothetical protein
MDAALAIVVHIFRNRVCKSFIIKLSNAMPTTEQRDTAQEC